MIRQRIVFVRPVLCTQKELVFMVHGTPQKRVQTALLIAMSANRFFGPLAEYMEFFCERVVVLLADGITAGRLEVDKVDIIVIVHDSHLTAHIKHSSSCPHLNAFVDKLTAQSVRTLILDGQYKAMPLAEVVEHVERIPFSGSRECCKALRDRLMKVVA